MLSTYPFWLIILLLSFVFASVALCSYKQVCCVSQHNLKSMEEIPEELDRVTEGQQPSSRLSSCSCARRNRRSTVSPQKRLPAGYCCACDQTLRKIHNRGDHEHLMSLRQLVLTAQHHAARVAIAREHQNWQLCRWLPIVVTDESRQSGVWRCQMNVTLPITSSSMTSLVVSQGWSWVAFPWRSSQISMS